MISCTYDLHYTQMKLQKLAEKHLHKKNVPAHRPIHLTSLLAESSVTQQAFTNTWEIHITSLPHE